MDYWQIVSNGMVIVGVPTLIGFVFKAGRKLQTLDSLEKTVNEDIKTDLKEVRERFIVVETQVGTMWKDRLAPASSPRQLNARGEDVLSKSGIKDIVDNNREKLLKIVKDKKPATAYDAEKIITEVMMSLPKHCRDSVPALKDGAFKVGADIETILFVGSIYLRNIIFDDLGFSLVDLDKKSNS